MLPLSFFSSFFLILLHFRTASAFWILVHNTLTTDRLDPIVTEGEVSGHVHTVVGASNFGPTVDTQSLQASECTTTSVQDDMSSYWAPQLYYQDEAGKLTLIPVLLVNTYYKLNAGPDENVSAFPADLRMVAGDPFRTELDESDASHKAVSFVCLDGGASPETHEFPKTNCPQGLRAQVTFPSCWDGENVDSSDHKSHMAYPEGSDPNAGSCPGTHPIRVITLFPEFIFDVNSFDFREGQNNWVFSFGDQVGYGFHADFVNGWKQEVLEDAVEQCTGDLFSNVQECPPFVDSINEEVAQGCKIDSQVDEDIGMDSPIDALPGCNSIPMDPEGDCSGSSDPSVSSGGGSSSNSSSTSTGSDESDGGSTAGTTDETATGSAATGTSDPTGTS